jgi:hypothetical protein
MTDDTTGASRSQYKYRLLQEQPCPGINPPTGSRIDCEREIGE